MKQYISEMLDAYTGRSLSPWHMPGHKRKPVLGGMWDTLFARDVTEVPGTDDYHHPEEAILRSQQEAAAVYGAAYSHYLVNGSTAGILAGVLALAELHKEKYDNTPVFLVAKNVHRSVHHALRLAGAECVELSPSEDPDYGPILPEEVESALKSFALSPGPSRQIQSQKTQSFQDDPSSFRCTGHSKGVPGLQDDSSSFRHPEGSLLSQKIAGCILTSPTYAGAVSPLREIHILLQNEGIPLLVDEAHGAHFPFMEELKNAGGIACGAELVVQSLHKTLPALTQTAILHVNGYGEEVQKLNAEVKRQLAVVQSSSPSYILLSSAEAAVAWAAESGRKFDNYTARLLAFRRRLADSLKCISLANYPVLQDPTRITLRLQDGLSAFKQKTRNRRQESGSNVHWQCQAPDNGGPVQCQTPDSNETEKVSFTGDTASFPTGLRAAAWLEEHWGIVAELAGSRELILISTVADTEEDLNRLYHALTELDRLCRSGNDFSQYSDINASNTFILQDDRAEDQSQPSFKCADPSGISLPRVGMTAEQDIYAYPPGILLIRKGEPITADAIQHIHEELRAGRKIKGC
ncbi:MAG: hypothetical protein IKN79_00095 [Eubacterium sp.]|nr:hypothetical protein [Eubacterium sp.]